jgi:hypothetical protein
MACSPTHRRAALLTADLNEDRPKFQRLALEDLQNLNDGTFHRYRLRPSEFKRWIEVHRPIRR